jgi:hypothetical protein
MPFAILLLLNAEIKKVIGRFNPNGWVARNLLF